MKEGIATNEHVKAFFRRFTLEDGGLVVLDIVHARDHARQCVNDLKRSRVKCPLFSVKKEPSDDKEVCLCKIVVPVTPLNPCSAYIAWVRGIVSFPVVRRGKRMYGHYL